MKLIVHIGVGKAGMTAVQMNLNAARKMLSQHKVEYWGTMLDKGPIQRFSWQKPRGFKDLRVILEQGGSEGLLKLLTDSLDHAARRGIETAIWSNENFYRQSDLTAPTLHKLIECGIEIMVIAFVRNYGAWAQSAYTQWGIKHKLIEGPVLPFAKYMEIRRIRLARPSLKWESEFGPNFKLLNYDLSEDVVARFLDVTGLPQINNPVRANESPGSEELLMRAIYSNSKLEEVNPRQFNALVDRKGVDFDFDAITWLKDYWPTDEQLRELVPSYQKDFDQINELLISKGEAPLDPKSKPAKPPDISTNKLITICLQMVLNQAEEINELRSKLEGRERSSSIFSRAVNYARRLARRP